MTKDTKHLLLPDSLEPPGPFDSLSGEVIPNPNEIDPAERGSWRDYEIEGKRHEHTLHIPFGPNKALRVKVWADTYLDAVHKLENALTKLCE